MYHKFLPLTRLERFDEKLFGEWMIAAQKKQEAAQKKETREQFEGFGYRTEEAWNQFLTHVCQLAGDPDPDEEDEDDED